MNQKDFGARVGVGLNVQSKYETGRHVPSAEYLARLAAIGVDVVYLLTGERSEGRPLGRDATELLEAFLELPPRMRQIARDVVLAMREDEDATAAPTVHDEAETYQPADRR